MNKKGLLYSTFLMGALVTGLAQGQITQAAASYPDALTANADGTITFEEEDDKVVPGPDDPDIPVVPDDPNIKPGDFKIVYVPSFDFGTHKKAVSGVEAFAKAVTVKDITETNELQKVPFITTKDMRVDRGKGWQLSAEASKFSSGTHTIEGAEIRLLDANYAKGTDTLNELNKPTVASNEIVLTPETAVPVASADTTSTVNQGLGLYSLALGKNIDSSGLTDGVKFSLPSNTAVNSSTYTSKIVWTLAPKL